MSERKTTIRLWPAVFIIVTATVLLVFVWFAGIEILEQIREIKVALTVLAAILSTLSLALWLLFFSRIPKRRALVVLGVFFTAVAAFFFLFRYRGMSGDLVPQFEARFASGTSESGVGSRGALANAMDYPQFLGPHRNGTLTGVSLARDWEASPPRVLWRRPVEAGHSGFAVSGNAAVTQEQHGEEERLTNYDLATGNLKWTSSEPTRYNNAMTGGGPRATPTIVDGRVYAVGATGILKALVLESGETLWKHDVLKDSGAEVPMYGVASSPLVVDGFVVVPTGGADGRALVAYDAETGDKVWSGGNDPLAYSSPFLASLAGVQQIVTLNQNSVTGHDPEMGRLMWRQEWPDRQSNVVQPLPIPGDRLLVSAGWGMGAKLYQISGNEAGALSSELVWESIHLKSKFSNSVYYEGFVYGLDDGIMVCLDPEDGRRVWKRGRYGHGQVLLVDDLLLVQTEHGEIVLVEPNPERHRELSRFRFTDEKTWNMPAIAGRYLLVRNDQEALLIELPVSS